MTINPKLETDTMKNSPILIIGKNAKTGLRVDQRLRALGHATRAVSRSTKPAFDWEDPATWPGAEESCDGVRKSQTMGRSGLVEMCRSERCAAPVRGFGSARWNSDCGT